MASLVPADLTRTHHTSEVTTRAFGRCSRRGCRHSHVLDLITKTTGRDAGRVYFRDGDGILEQASGGYFPQVDAKMRAAGLTCPDHGATMVYEGLKATYNPEKTCDGRCMSAKRASCDCSCGGENHGKHA